MPAANDGFAHSVAVIMAARAQREGKKLSPGPRDRGDYRQSAGHLNGGISEVCFDGDRIRYPLESQGEEALARGRFLRLFIGNMASGKTRHLLTEIETLRKYGNKKIARVQAADGRSQRDELYQEQEGRRGMQPRKFR